ncbi:MAG TPA: ATP-binding cassette domain-containing protein [Acidimicrobiia bacterium]|nr:ATP-binding cassette domain-containing protein [Acidimicrobiia bacterium]
MSLLEISGVSVRFGGLEALGDVSLGVDAGRVTGLIGPNGAGKTTLFNVITGLQAPDGGHVRLAGDDITNARPHRRARAGIGRSFQRLETFGTLTVRENVLVAAEMRRQWSKERFKPGPVVTELIERVGLEPVADELVDTLPTGTQRLVEVARALAAKPRVLLLDEPSAGLNEHETESLAALLRDLAATGLGVLLVEHDMGLVMNASDRIYVLDFGHIIASGDPAQVQADPLVRAAYLGEGDEEADVPRAQRELREEIVVDLAPLKVAGNGTAAERPQELAIELRDVRAAYGTIDVLHGVTLQIRPKQVFALLGPNGAGKSTTLRVASGQMRPTGGTVSFLGERVNGWSADRLARSGLCTIPEGRGVFPNLTVLENLRMITYTGAPFRDIEEQAYHRFPRLKERRKQVAGTLSGGEQQMLAMARAMAANPRVLLLDEVSMGLAPLVVEEIYEVVRRIATEDVAILIVEQFAHEVLGVADVAAIMLHGRVEYLGKPGEVSEALQHAYLGGAVEAELHPPPKT